MENRPLPIFSCLVEATLKMSAYSCADGFASPEPTAQPLTISSNSGQLGRYDRIVLASEVGKTSELRFQTARPNLAIRKDRTKGKAAINPEAHHASDRYSSGGVHHSGLTTSAAMSAKGATSTLSVPIRLAKKYFPLATKRLAHSLRMGRWARAAAIALSAFFFCFSAFLLSILEVCA